MTIKELLSMNIKNIIDNSGKTQREIAYGLRTPIATISSWYTGDKLPRIDKLDKFANYFNINTSFLFGAEKASDKLTDTESAIISELQGMSEEEKLKYLEIIKQIKEIKCR